MNKDNWSNSIGQMHDNDAILTKIEKGLPNGTGEQQVDSGLRRPDGVHVSQETVGRTRQYDLFVSGTVC